MGFAECGESRACFAWIAAVSGGHESCRRGACAGVADGAAEHVVAPVSRRAAVAGTGDASWRAVQLDCGECGRGPFASGIACPVDEFAAAPGEFAGPGIEFDWDRSGAERQPAVCGAGFFRGRAATEHRAAGIAN